MKIDFRFLKTIFLFSLIDSGNRLAPVSFLLAPVTLISRTQVFQIEQSGIGINWINGALGALGCLLTDFYREIRCRTKKHLDQVLELTPDPYLGFYSLK